MDYIPITKSFQALRCLIKARDPRLHWNSVTALGFLTTGLIPEDTLTIDPIPEGIPKVALPFQHATEEEATSSQPATKEEEEGEELEVVEVTDFEDKFAIFNQPLSLKLQVGNSSHLHLVPADSTQEDTTVSEKMGIQHKPRLTF